MGSFAEHIDQSVNNMKFLASVNSNINNQWDWQVTVCFYSALHLINAHVVAKTGRNYLSHSQVAEHINPYNALSLAKLEEDIYVSYNKLYQLSRRSRYLLNENFKKGEQIDIQPACITYSKHFKRSIHHLNNIISYIASEYKITFGKTDISCIDLNGQQFAYFTIINN